MKENQEFTPKYWVAHDKRADDVFLESASKNIKLTQIWLCNKFGECWMDNGNLGINLFELSIVNTKGS